MSRCTFMMLKSQLRPAYLILVLSCHQNKPSGFLVDVHYTLVPWLHSPSHRHSSLATQLSMHAKLWWCLFVCFCFFVEGDKLKTWATPPKVRYSCSCVTRYQFLHIKVGMEQTLLGTHLPPSHIPAAIWPTSPTTRETGTKCSARTNTH